MGVEVVRVWESAKESGRMDGVVGLQVVVNSRADLMGKAKTVVRQAKGAVPREKKKGGKEVGPVIRSVRGLDSTCGPTGGP